VQLQEAEHRGVELLRLPVGHDHRLEGVLGVVVHLERSLVIAPRTKQPDASGR